MNCDLITIHPVSLKSENDSYSLMRVGHRCARGGHSAISPMEHGEMAEWLKALVSKTSVGETQSGVRISLSPQ